MMKCDRVRLIKANMLPERIMENLRRITAYYRTQFSPEIRAAEEECLKTLKKHGVSGRILRYPTKEQDAYMNYSISREWSCTGGRLVLDDTDKILCEHGADSMGIIMRSPAGKLENARLIPIPAGSREEDFETVDMTGAVMLVEGDCTEFAEWAVKKGVIGVITDRIQAFKGVREKADTPDVRGYNSFSDKSVLKYGLLGFCVTPRQGQALRKLCAEMEKAHREDPEKPACPTVSGYVESRFYDGEINVLEAEIPGESDEAVLVSAHICHPKPCANDNASGCAGAMEILLTLSELIQQGKLPKPKRSIRMLLLPEMTGTAAWLSHISEEERKKILAAINLDMIGARQGRDRGAGPVCAFRPRESMASFTTDLFELLMDSALEDHPAVFLFDHYLSCHHFEVFPFCGGSDHQVLGDPSVGIPCISLNQWPDILYHTSGDTCERIDPSLIRAAAAMAGGYLYAMAGLEEEDIPYILQKVQQSFASRLCEIGMRNEDPELMGRKIRHAKEVACMSIRDLKRFFPERDLEPLLEREEKALSLQAEAAMLRLGASLPKEEDGDLRRIRRVRMGPVDSEKLSQLMKEDRYSRLREKRPSCGGMETTFLWWLDGQRTVAEAAEHAVLEWGYGDAEYASLYTDLLCESGQAEEIQS